VRDQVLITTFPPKKGKQNLYHIIFIYCPVPHKLKEQALDHTHCGDQALEEAMDLL
jgi:hypothetical protein